MVAGRTQRRVKQREDPLAALLYGTGLRLGEALTLHGPSRPGEAPIRLGSEGGRWPRRVAQGICQEIAGGGSRLAMAVGIPGDAAIRPQRKRRATTAPPPCDGVTACNINDQYRICFGWTDVGPEAVEIVDYH